MLDEAPLELAIEAEVRLKETLEGQQKDSDDPGPRTELDL